MGNVGLINQSNVIINVALCQGITHYYEANQVYPDSPKGVWSKVGQVCWNIVMVPWFGSDSEFGNCGVAYHEYTKRLDYLARAVSQTGSAKIGYIQITGTNITYDQAHERLRNMAFWGTGYCKIVGCTLIWEGGPPASAVSIDPHVIDISHPFPQLELYFNPQCLSGSSRLVKHVPSDVYNNLIHNNPETGLGNEVMDGFGN